MGSMFSGGSTGDAFSPLLTGATGGLPLGGSGLGAGGGLGAGAGGGLGAGGVGGGGLGAGGGLGSLSSLGSRSDNATVVRSGPVLSGVTSPGMANERFAAAGAGGGGVPMSPGGHGGGGSGERARRDAVVSSTLPSYVDLPRRPS